MEKLVRDKIPDLMREAGVEPQIRRANQNERIRLLILKLHEEVEELELTPCIEECVDVFEVVATIAEELGVSRDELFAAALKKATARGQFRMGYILEIRE